LTYLKYSATLLVVKCCTYTKMPTKKRRIGFIPKSDVLNLIYNISEEEKLSNSKVVNILIEEALYARGLINKVEKTFAENDFRDFTNKVNYFQEMLNEKIFKIDDKEEFMQSKNNTKLIKRFIQFLHFKKMMKIYEVFDKP